MDMNEHRNLGFFKALLLCGGLAVLLLLAVLLGGCTTDPETGNVTIRVPARAVEVATNALAKAAAEGRKEQTSVEAPVPAGEGEAGVGGHAHPCEEPEAAGTEGSFDAVWRFGGFDGSKAKEVAGCRIGSLRMDRDGMSYKWVSGGCEALGASGREDWSHTVACMAYWDGSKWVAGKFDWISTSRTSRSFENIRDGYGGWDGTSFFAARKHGFVIVSADGKRRSNFIED